MSGTRGGGARSGARFAYQPALDGVRAIAVAMVLCFHAGFGWMSGGYVGVSVFFTLSGYLITSLALREHSSTGSVDVRAFYGRRVRRLLPASGVCLVGVVVLVAAGQFDRLPNVRRDLWAALGQVYNWVALAGGTSYQEQVEASAGRLSPLDHYWSLAIEEQFYWVWPVVLAVALPRLRTASSRVAGIVALTALAGAAAPLIAWTWGPDAAYWATPARFGEILVGAALAVVAHERRRRRIVDGPRVRWLAGAGIIVIVAAAVTWPAGSGPAYRGWLPLFAVASAALIAGLQVDSPLRRALAWRPLVMLGVISYGVYLYHWPVYAVLHPGRLDVPTALLFAIRVGVTLALATVSYAVLERPVRQARWAWRPVSRLALAGGLAAALLIAVVVPAGRGAYWLASDDDLAAAEIESVESVGALAARGGDSPDNDPQLPGTIFAPPPPAATVISSASPAPTAVPPFPAVSAPETPTTLAAAAPDATAPTSDADTTSMALGLAAVPTVPDSLSRPVRILVFGDSTASATGNGLVTWAAAHPTLAEVSVRWAPGCGFFRAGTVPDASAEFEADCADRHTELPSDVAMLQPDVVVLMSTLADVEDRLLDGAEDVVRPSDEAFVAALDAEYERFVQALMTVGVPRVAWISPPTPRLMHSSQDIERGRHEVLREALHRVATTHPDVVTLVDLAAWDDQHPDLDRPDGLHYSPESAAQLADQFLAPLLISIALS